MKKCLICKKKLDNFIDKLCDTCVRFFEWKYGKVFEEWLAIIESFEKDKKRLPSCAIKYRRLNK